MCDPKPNLNTTPKRVQVLSGDGTFVRSKTNEFVSSCDTKKRVQVLRGDGTFVRSIGNEGNGVLQFKGPLGVAVDQVCV